MRKNCTKTAQNAQKLHKMRKNCTKTAQNAQACIFIHPSVKLDAKTNTFVLSLVLNCKLFLEEIIWRL